jgi:heme-degrading monooxygenase HmoA
MAVTMDVRMPSEAAQLYEPLNRELGVNKDRLPDGLIHHFATRTRDGFNIFEVWESQEAFDRFANDRLLPALKKLVGAQASQIRPAFGELHNEFHR